MICEIGAFDAGDSIRMRKLVPSARIFAFEANPHNHARYKAQAEEAGVVYERLAIADHDGDISFNIVREEGVNVEKARQVAGQSSIFATLDEHKISEPTTVPCQRLDAYLRSKASEAAVIALWIDAESAGYQVLLGAREALKRARLIKIETEYWPYRLGQNLVGDIRSLLVEAGFVELANNDTNLGQCDLLWIRV